MSFTKGLHHGDNGILTNNAHYSSLTEAINQDAATDFTQLERGITDEPSRQPKTVFSGDAVDMEDVAPEWRGWESPRAGHYFSLEGPDADAVGMPAAPALGSAELNAEMAEVYALALLRDNSFSEIAASTTAQTPSGIKVSDVLDAMTSVDWYADKTEGGLTLQERRRRAARFASHGEHNVDNPPNNGVTVRKDLFRGSAPGVKAGPYLSQFMVQGTQLAKDPTDGPDVYSHSSLRYGSQEIDQKVTFFPKAVDYMLHWNAYLDVQNGADFSAANIRSHLPRGGPHVLSLVTEVATRCLKAVRRQKYNYHRRARPERLGALLSLNAGALSEAVAQASLTPATRGKLNAMHTELSPLLTLVKQHNQSRRSDTSIRDDRPARKDGVNVTERQHADPHLMNSSQQLDPDNWDDDENVLLPMAFTEGSPMHPSYGAGHATVAGGCVTILKAFFHTTEADGSAVAWPQGLPVLQVESGGEKLRDISATDSAIADEPVTIAGELNKLAANIAIGRNMAGVHFYTDYYESLRMGERVSTGILIEHMMMKDEPVEMTFTSFDGG